MLKLATLAVAAALAGGSHQPAFEGHSERLDGKLRDRIEGSSWHPGCPVGLDKLRLLDLPYADRSRHARGMIHAGDAVIQAFKRKAGWEWLGDGSRPYRDYQHFSADGS